MTTSDRKDQVHDPKTLRKTQMLFSNNR